MYENAQHIKNLKKKHPKNQAITFNHLPRHISQLDYRR